MAAEFIEKLNDTPLETLSEFQDVIERLTNANNELAVRDVCTAVAHVILKSSKYKRKMIIDKIKTQSLLSRFLLSHSFKMIEGHAFPIREVLVVNLKKRDDYMPPPPFLRVVGKNEYCNLGVKTGNSTREVNTPAILKIENVIKVVMSRFHTLFLTVHGQVFGCGLKANVSIVEEIRNKTDVYVEPVLIHFPSTSTSEPVPIIDIEASDNCSLLFSEEHIYLIGGGEFRCFLPGRRITRNCRKYKYSVNDTLYTQFDFSKKDEIKPVQPRVHSELIHQNEILTLAELHHNPGLYTFEDESIQNASTKMRFFKLMAIGNKIPLQNNDRTKWHLKTLLYGLIISVDIELENNVICYHHWAMYVNRPIIICLNGRRVNKKVDQIILTEDGHITVRFAESFVATGKLEFWRRRETHKTDEFKINKHHWNLEISRKLRMSDLVAVLEETYGTVGVRMLISSPDCQNIIMQCGEDNGDIDASHKFGPELIDTIRDSQMTHGLLEEDQVPMDLLLVLDSGDNVVWTNRGIFELSYPYAKPYIMDNSLDFPELGGWGFQIMESYISGTCVAVDTSVNGIVDGIIGVPFVMTDGSMRYRLRKTVLNTQFIPENCAQKDIFVIKTIENKDVPVFAPLMLLHGAKFFHKMRLLSNHPDMYKTYTTPFSIGTVESALNCLLDMDLLVWLPMAELIRVYIFFQFHQMKKAIEVTKQIMMNSVCDENIEQVYFLVDIEDKEFVSNFETQPFHFLFSNSPVIPTSNFCKKFCDFFEEVDENDELMDFEEQNGSSKRCPRGFLNLYHVDDIIRNFLNFENDTTDVLTAFSKECEWPLSALERYRENFLELKQVNTEINVFKIEHLLLLTRGVTTETAATCDSVFADNWNFRDFIKKHCSKIDSDSPFFKIVQDFEVYNLQKTREQIGRHIFLKSRRPDSRMQPHLVLIDAKGLWTSHLKLCNVTLIMFCEPGSNMFNTSGHTLRLNNSKRLEFCIQSYDRECRQSNEEIVQSFRRIGLDYTTSFTVHELKYYISSFQAVQLDVPLMERALRLDLVQDCNTVIVFSEEDALDLSAIWHQKHENLG